MTCHDVRALFSDWADEALTADERARVDAHLAQCADCRKELERFTATIALLHRMERPRAPVGFVDRVLAAKPLAPWHRRLFQRLFLPLSVKLPAEAAALLLVAGLAVYVFQRTPDLQHAAWQDTLRSGSRPVAPAPPPARAPAMQEARRSGLLDRPRDTSAEAERKLMATREDTTRSAPAAAVKTPPPAAPRAGAAPPVPGSEPTIERQAQPSDQFRKETGAQNVTAPTASEPPASQDRAAPVEGAAKAAPPTAGAPGGAAPAPRDQPTLEATKEAKARSLAAPAAPQPAPSETHRAPVTEGRAESEKDKLAGSLFRAAPPSSSAVRVLPSADVVGRLTVKDRVAAERALRVLLARAGGVVISRRDDARTTLVEVAVPKASYPEFSQGLARLGAWHAEGEPSELPPDVRVTLRLVE
jgi:putative zinc finger protein